MPRIKPQFQENIAQSVVKGMQEIIVCEALKIKQRVKTTANPPKLTTPPTAGEAC